MGTQLTERGKAHGSLVLAGIRAAYAEGDFAEKTADEIQAKTQAAIEAQRAIVRAVELVGGACQLFIAIEVPEDDDEFAFFYDACALGRLTRSVPEFLRRVESFFAGYRAHLLSDGVRASFANATAFFSNLRARRQKLREELAADFREHADEDAAFAEAWSAVDGDGLDGDEN